MTKGICNTSTTSSIRQSGQRGSLAKTHSEVKLMVIVMLGYGYHGHEGYASMYRHQEVDGPERSGYGYGQDNQGCRCRVMGYVRPPQSQGSSGSQDAEEALMMHYKEALAKADFHLYAGL